MGSSCHYARPALDRLGSVFCIPTTPQFLAGLDGWPLQPTTLDVVTPLDVLGLDWMDGLVGPLTYQFWVIPPVWPRPAYPALPPPTIPPSCAYPIPFTLGPMDRSGVGGGLAAHALRALRARLPACLQHRLPASTLQHLLLLRACCCLRTTLRHYHIRYCRKREHKGAGNARQSSRLSYRIDMTLEYINGVAATASLARMPLHSASLSACRAAAVSHRINVARALWRHLVKWHRLLTLKLYLSAGCRRYLCHWRIADIITIDAYNGSMKQTVL